MQIGVVFPQTEIGANPADIAAYARAAEGAGYDYLLAYDHVLGAEPDENVRRPYTADTMFHEPFVLFGYLAGITERIEFVSGVIILPQRQTALVAKQAAAIDVLSGGRLRLGIGIGWNDVEYEALGEEFHNRGKRSEEQVALLRALWAEPVIDFKGEHHTVTRAGINPLPVKRDIPIWFGGASEPVLDRIGRIGDGWLPLGRGPEMIAPALERIHASAKAAGRDASAIGVDAQVPIGKLAPGEAVEQVKAWFDAGATHVAVNTMSAGLATPAEHIATIEAFKAAWDQA